MAAVLVVRADADAQHGAPLGRCRPWREDVLDLLRREALPVEALLAVTSQQGRPHRDVAGVIAGVGAQQQQQGGYRGENTGLATSLASHGPYVRYLYASPGRFFCEIMRITALPPFQPAKMISNILYYKPPPDHKLRMGPSELSFQSSRVPKICGQASEVWSGARSALLNLGLRAHRVAFGRSARTRKTRSFKKNVGAGRRQGFRWSERATLCAFPKKRSGKKKSVEGRLRAKRAERVKRSGLASAMNAHKQQG
jgi:hypothetical protein